MSSMEEQEQPSASERRAPAEWVTLVVSIVIVVAFLSLATWLSIRGQDDPPKVTVDVHLEDVRTEGDLFYLPVTVTNEGGRTISDAIVEGELSAEGTAPEAAEVTINFLAGRESERGTLVFTIDPRDGELSVRVTSYLDP